MERKRSAKQRNHTFGKIRTSIVAGAVGDVEANGGASNGQKENDQDGVETAD